MADSLRTLCFPYLAGKMPPKKKDDGPKEKPILGRFRTNLKVSRRRCRRRCRQRLKLSSQIRAPIATVRSRGARFAII